MDEIPFLDTDIARGGFLLTRESFSFWLMENELKLSEELSEDIAYVLIQFIEIGLLLITYLIDLFRWRSLR